MKKYLIPFFSALPGVLIGMLIMYKYEVSITIYMQNIFYLVICSLLSILYLRKEFKLKLKGLYIVISFSIFLLCSTFFFEGIEGVHRWVNIGPFSLNAAFISLPILLISIYKLSNMGHLITCYILNLIISVILFLQPDASMLTAFFIALIPFYYKNFKNIFFKYTWIILLILSFVSWVNLDHVAPVPYVEDIVLIAKNQGLLYLFCCIICFVILLIPFFKKNNRLPYRTLSISLGLFFFVLILSTIFGNFPVPLIGYGISPIAGYILSVSYITKRWK